MLHTQVSKVMQVKKQKKKKKICFSLVSALALLPYTSTTQVKKRQQKNQPKSTNIDIVCKISI